MSLAVGIDFTVNQKVYVLYVGYKEEVDGRAVGGCRVALGIPRNNTFYLRHAIAVFFNALVG